MGNKNIPKFSREGNNQKTADNTIASSPRLGIRAALQDGAWEDEPQGLERESLTSIAAKFANGSNAVPAPARGVPRADGKQKRPPAYLSYLGAAFFTATVSGGMLYYFLTSGGLVNRVPSGGKAADTARTNQGGSRLPLQAIVIDAVPVSTSPPPAKGLGGIEIEGASKGQATARPNPAVLPPREEGGAVRRLEEERQPESRTPPAASAAPETATLSPRNDTGQRDVTSLPAAEIKTDERAEADRQPKKLSSDEEARMLKRASDLLGGNDFASARLIYKYLMEHGSAAGADFFKRLQSQDPGKTSAR
jgi:hypothetical protein